MKTLVHAFVTSRVDYANIILVGAPKSVTNKLQRVLNAAARIVIGTRKYDQGLSHLLHTELHWMDVLERVHGLPMFPGQGAAVFVELLCASL